MRQIMTIHHNRILINIIRAMVMMIVTGSVYPEDYYTYIAPNGWREEFRFEPPNGNDTNGLVIYGGDARVVSKYCPQDSDYFCVFSAYYAFAIPKNFRSEAPIEWRVDNYVFRRIGEKRKVSILGINIDDVYLIQTPPEATMNGKESGKPTNSFYSPTVGLIGFDDVRWSGFYWLTGSVGFGVQRKQ